MLLVRCLRKVLGPLGLFLEALADESEVGGGFFTAPKWVRASGWGLQPSTMAIESIQVSISISGGGVGGTMRSTPGIETAATSPTKAVPRLIVHVGDMVGCVAGGVGDPHAEQLLTTRQGIHIVRGNRQDLAPEVLHLIAVESLGAGQEL